MRRHVLALLEGAGPNAEVEDPVHTLLEMPLNHLGLVVHRHYIDKGPPPDAWLNESCAVLTYFTSIPKQPVAWLWPWMERARVGRRVLHFGNFGVLHLEPNRLARWLKHFGLDHDSVTIDDAGQVSVRFVSHPLCLYEADPRSAAIHLGPRSKSNKNQVWVETAWNEKPDDKRAPVVLGDWGGIALYPWAIRHGSGDVDQRWHIDPFLFLRDALGVAGQPAPHPSVLNGRRMWITQVDGDGFESLSTVKRGEYCAEVMDREIFSRYRLPYTVSVIVRSLTDDFAVAEPTRAMKVARTILNRPWIEPASHGVLHTLKWQVDLLPTHKARTIMWYASLKNYEYSQINEVSESIRFINTRLLNPDKRCAVMLWTGAANPRENAIAAADAAGAVNLNGGVFRWDIWYDSVSYVSPWSRRVGQTLQVYAGAANENDFEGFFTTMPGSFRHIDTTLERTGSPRILKPVDLYIHFYSAENAGRLATIHQLIKKWAYEKPTAPVHASVYARAVRSAVNTAKIERNEDGWTMIDFHDCRTVRIDGDRRHVDLHASNGLLGARRIGESLYVHLAQSDARVVLRKETTVHPHIREANCLLDDGKITPHGVRVRASGVQEQTIVFAGLPKSRFIRVLVDATTAERRTEPDGTITVRVPAGHQTRVEVGSIADAE